MSDIIGFQPGVAIDYAEQLEKLGLAFSDKITFFYRPLPPLW